MRAAAFLTAICMAIIAIGAGAAAHVYLGLGRVEAAGIAAAILTALVLLYVACRPAGARSVPRRQLADLSRGSADAARQVAEMEGRLAALEEKLEAALDHSRAITDPLALEIEELGTLLKGLAETVVTQQTIFEALAREVPAPEETPVEPQAAATQPGDMACPDPDAIRAAVELDRFELYLQPIVGLPQRKVRFYEALGRLRLPTGELLQTCDFVPLAESIGSMPSIDNRMMFLCVQALRRLARKTPDVGLFCSLSPSTLLDEPFAKLLEFLAANRALAPSFVLQFTQQAVRGMGAREHESLAALTELGFRFCISEVPGLRLEPAELAQRGFRYVKMRADVLLNPARHAPGDVQPADLSDLLGRFGIALVVDGIQNEGSVIELLDHDVQYAEGPLFSQPRPVRADALQVVPDSPGAIPVGIDVLEEQSGNASAIAPEAGAPALPSEQRREGAALAGTGANG
jgi:cyclic-di-GMP phosphodiesterase TipF (flagellum assembly factor)